MICISQLKQGQNFYSDEFDEKLWIQKETPKMVYYTTRCIITERIKTFSTYIKKESLLQYLNACNFEILK